LTDEQFNLLVDMRWALQKLDTFDMQTNDKRMLSEDDAIRKYGRGD